MENFNFSNENHRKEILEIRNRLAKLIHPDLGGNNEDMIRLNAAYEKALAGDPGDLLAMTEEWARKQQDLVPAPKTSDGIVGIEPLEELDREGITEDRQKRSRIDRYQAGKKTEKGTIFDEYV
jgi:hypothetical protein